MFKIIIIFIIPAFITIFSPASYGAEDDGVFSSRFYDDVLLGTAAGLVIGLAVAQGSITTFRITSLGFYGGIVLGLTTGGGNNRDDRQNQTSDLAPKTPTYVFTFHY